MQGMDSKNMKSRAECCEALADTLREWGVDVLYHGPRSKRTSLAIKRLAACTAERDAKLRKSALGALMVVLEQEGARFWQLLGEDLPSTQADLIKERARFVELEMTKRGVAPGATVRPHPLLATVTVGEVVFWRVECHTAMLTAHCVSRAVADQGTSEGRIEGGSRLKPARRSGRRAREWYAGACRGEAGPAASCCAAARRPVPPC